MNNKIIVTNLSALTAKYGAAGLKKIRAAIKTLIAADKARGFQTRLIALDSATAMSAMKAKQVAKADNPKQYKDAIDAICRELVPDYLMLLGSIDVIPLQDLHNPVYGGPGGDDPDEFAPGDLSYACEAPYSQEAKDFIGPTRVVGRLPDITGGKDPAYLLGLLNTAANWKSLSPADYASYFAISAAVWKSSTELSVQKLFGSSTALQLTPPAGPNWRPATLAKRSHFINCHGAESDPQFYGQKGNSYPVSHRASYVAGKITAGTVAAVECCYGAQLYDPALARGQAGIGNTYLGNGAYGYLGSSTIAYGPAVGNGSADLLCQYFLRRIMGGASLGRATLEARLEFAGGAAELDPIDVKTIAQFGLLGDPSIHPVAVAGPHTAVAKFPRLGGTKAGATGAGEAIARSDRRRQLLSRGMRILATQSYAATTTQQSIPTALTAALKKLAAQLDITAPKILSFKVETPVAPKGMMRAAAMAKMGAPSAFHVVTGKQHTSELPTPQITALVAKEVNGSIISYREMLSR